MRVPAVEFLDEIERLYSVKYPKQYRELCAQLKDTDFHSTNGSFDGADFITDIETFWSVNVRVGEGEWGDYEFAIAGKRHPKDKNMLWGGILPFFFEDSVVFGFSSAEGSDDSVYVWNIHTIVGYYHSLSRFADKYLRHSMPVLAKAFLRILPVRASAALR